MSTHVSDLAAQHDADARDEAASDRAGVAHLMPDTHPGDQEPSEPREWCSLCEHGHTGVVCRWCVGLGRTS
jgi:hypothetical protein